MYSRRTTTPGFGGSGGFSGLTGPIPRDLLILFGVLFVTFAMQYFAATQLIEFLRLTPLVWQSGFVWQVVTYPFIGYGGGIFFLISLIFLYLFARDVFNGLGRRHFWRLVLATAVGSALVALLVDVLLRLAGWVHPAPFGLMQGQLLLWAAFVAAFATANRGTTIYLIIFPIEARWFLALEILIAFIGFLQSKDFAGFVGICTAVGIGYWYVRSGGKGIRLRELRLRMERRWIQWKLDRGKRKRGFRVIPGDRDRSNGGVRKGPWVH
ncbi:MAG TPA: hypothetical protein VEW48_13345 [Thermoanaerobaculia bacterium]|nr:hypothetical protein [Thermoanaerobaculia bacterium]